MIEYSFKDGNENIKVKASMKKWYSSSCLLTKTSDTFLSIGDYNYLGEIK